MAATTTLVARIGMGDKLHPIVQHERYGILFVCHCPATQSGQAKITWKGEGTATCGK